MRLKFLPCWLLLTAIPTLAMVEGSAPPIETRFLAADQVCSATVLSSVPISQNGPQSEQASVKVTGTYKGTLQPGSILRITVPARTTAPRVGASYLIFLSEPTPSGAFEAGPGTFEPMPILASSNTALHGLDKLRNDLAASFSDANAPQGLDETLDFASEFATIDAKTAQLIDDLSGNSSKQIRIKALAILSTEAPNPGMYAHELARELASTPERAYPHPEELGPALMFHTTASDLENLEAVASKSPDRATRVAAMNGIRRMKDQTAIPFFVKMLSSDDPNVQYDAVIGLAEITHAASAYAPSFRSFNQNKDHFITLWSEWAHKKGIQQ